MQLEMQLKTENEYVLSVNYHYHLGVALQAALTEYAPALAKELHDGIHRNRLKLFLYSGLNSMPAPFITKLQDGTSALSFSGRLWMRIGSIWPELIYTLAEALLARKVLEIRGQRIQISEIKMVPTPSFSETMVYRPFGQAGFMVCRYQKDGKVFFQYPDNPEKEIPSCEELTAFNLKHKMFRLKEIRPDIFANMISVSGLSENELKQLPIKIEFLPLTKEKPYKPFLIKVKDGAIRGFRAPVKVTAPEAIHQIIWSCGLGCLNCLGVGLVQLGRNE